MRRAMVESFLVGGALVAALTAVLTLGGALLGLWTSPHPLVGLLGAVGGAVVGWGAHRPIDNTALRVGAVAAGGAAMAAEVLTASPGLGTVQMSAAAMAVLAVWVGPTLVELATRPVPSWLVALGFLAVGFALVEIVIDSGPLGHDESAYALKARAWIEGTPHTGWSIHRGIGQSVLAALILPFSHSSEALRLVAAALALGTVVAVWAVGREIRSSRVGIAAAAMFGVAPSFLRRGAEFLTDIPSTGLLLVVAVLLWRWATRENATARDLYGAVLVAAIAVYIRYQSVLALALLGVATLAIAREKIGRRRPDVVKAAGLGFVLLMPHFIYATVATGVPWGVIADTAEAGGRSFLGQGLVDYARDFPDLLAGQLGAVAILVALGWFVWSAMGHGQRRAAVFLSVPALGQVLILGLISHGEPRFVFFPVALLTVAAALAVDDLRRRTPKWVYRAVVAGFVVAVAASVSVHGVRFDRYAEARAGSFGTLAEAADMVVEQSQEECGIVTGLQPQMTWLSGCYTAPFDLSHVRVDLDENLDRFLLLSEGGPREPEGTLKDAYTSLAEQPPVRLEGSGSTGDVEVWRLTE